MGRLHNNARAQLIASLRGVETRPGPLFYRLWDPSDFDFSMENMRVRIKSMTDFWQGWRMLGMFGGPLERWLTRYIETASEQRNSYAPGNKQAWVSLFMEKYPGEDYRMEDLELYFNTLYQLYGEGQVLESIYAPYTYTPEKEGVAEKTGRLATRALVGTGLVLVAAVGAYSYIRYGRK